MAYDETLAQRIRQLLHPHADVTERKMFGGLAFMYRQRMCCGIVGRDLVVRVPDDECETVMRRRHVRPMDFTGKPLKGFCVRLASRRSDTDRPTRVACSRREVRGTTIRSR
jgi:hypothetical protein